MPKSAYIPQSLGPNFPIPQNEFWEIESWAGGFDASDAQEDIPAGGSPDMQDMEATEDDRLVRAPGVTSIETLSKTPTQVVLHAGFDFTSELVFISDRFLGVKAEGATNWIDAGLNTTEPYAFTNFAGILVFSNGVIGTYSRDPHTATVPELIPGAPAGQALAVFADRLLIGATDLDGKHDLMAVRWSAANSDFKDWTSEGAGGESLIGTMQRADRIQAMFPLGFDLLSIVCRRSLWTGTPTGDVFEPIHFVPRIEDVGCTHAATVVPTEYGVIFLSDDGVRLHTGNDAQIISHQINAELLPIDEAEKYTATLDPQTKRYYLCTPTETWVLDLVRKRWFKWTNTFVAPVFWATQTPGKKWTDLVGAWSAQTLAWWQYGGSEAAGKIHFLRGNQLGKIDPTNFQVFGTNLDPRWFDRRGVGQNQDQLMTHLGARFTYEADADSSIDLWLPKKPSGDYEFVRSQTLPTPVDKTRRVWSPFIHTGRGVGLGIRITSGSPRIRRASVEFQRTSLPWEEFVEQTTPQPPQTVSLAAIMSPRQLFYDSMDAGVMQSFGGATPAGGRSADRPGRYSVVGGEWEFHATGGRDGGGWMKAVSAKTPASLVASGSFFTLGIQGPSAGISLGTGDEVWEGPGESAIPRWTGGEIAFNQFGIVPDGTTRIFINGIIGISTPIDVLRITVRPDYGIDVERVTRNGSGDRVYTLLSASDPGIIPVDGWYQIERQVGLCPRDAKKGGFVLLRVTTDSSLEGVWAANVVGVQTTDFDAPTNDWPEHSDSFTIEAQKDIGVDDHIYYESTGSERRFLLDTCIEACFPTSDSAVTSVVNPNHSDIVPGAPPFPYGGSIHGSADRWRNVSSVRDDRVWNDSLVIRGFLVADIDEGGVYLSGPLAVPPDPIVGNTVEDNGQDLFGISPQRARVSIEGVAPFLLSGRVNHSAYYNTELITGTFPGGVIITHGNHKQAVDTGSVLTDFQEHSPTNIWTMIRPVIKSGSTVLAGPPMVAPDAGGGSALVADRSWAPFRKYSINPYTVNELDPATNSRWSVAAALGHLTGYKGDVSFNIPSDPDPPGVETRWVEVDVIQCGSEIAYHRAIIQQGTIPLSNPLCDVRFDTTDLSLGIVSAYHNSVDFNDGEAHILDHVTATINWGDTTVDAFVGPGSTNTISHTYAMHGVYTITFTATNAHGLTCTSTLQVTVTAGLPVAEFSSTADLVTDPTGHLFDFSDASTELRGTITAWAWDFDSVGAPGVHTSTLRNPTFDFTALGDGDYVVKLTVTDDQSRTAFVTHTVTVPAVAPGAGNRVNMPIVFANQAAGTLAQFIDRADFISTNPTLIAAGGRDGNNAVEEVDDGGGISSFYMQWTKIGSVTPHAYQFCFDLQGKTLPAYEVPILEFFPTTIALVLAPSGKLRFYADPGSGTPALIFETAAAVPGTGFVQGTLRFKFGASGVAFSKLRVNGEILSDATAAIKPTGSITSVAWGTGSGFDYGYTPASYAGGIAGVRWCDCYAFDDSTAGTDDDYPGDVHTALSIPQAIGDQNDSGGSAANAQSADDGATNVFSAAGQFDLFTVNSPAGTLATILAVLGSYVGKTTGTAGAKTLHLLVKSGGVLSESPDVTGTIFNNGAMQGSTVDRFVLVNDPGTGSPWANAAAIGAAQVGLKLTAVNAGGTYTYGELGLETAYWDS